MQYEGEQDLFLSSASVGEGRGDEDYWLLFFVLYRLKLNLLEFSTVG